jgi:phosphohistidine phosphatase
MTADILSIKGHFVTLSLLLLRHAKAANESIKDHERSLAPRGQRDAVKIAHYLEASDLKPDLVMCSTAKRARLTLDSILTIWPDLNVSYENEIYLASTEMAVAHLRQGGSANRILLVGHNPTMEDLLRVLTDQRNTSNAALSDALSKYPTGALAELSIDCKRWDELNVSCGQLKRFIKPRTLEESAAD